MAHEDDPRVDEVPQFEVGGLEGGQVFGGDGGVQISRFDTWELGQIVHHLLRGGDVIINEGLPFQYTMTETISS